MSTPAESHSSYEVPPELLELQRAINTAINSIQLGGSREMAADDPYRCPPGQMRIGQFLITDLSDAKAGSAFTYTDAHIREAKSLLEANNGRLSAVVIIMLSIGCWPKSTNPILILEFIESVRDGRITDA